MNTPLTLPEIVKAYLDENHYDGLYSPDHCACRKSHLFEYCEYNYGPTDCCPGHNPKEDICKQCDSENCEAKGEPDAWISEHTICGRVEEIKS